MRLECNYIVQWRDIIKEVIFGNVLSQLRLLTSGSESVNINSLSPFNSPSKGVLHYYYFVHYTFPVPGYQYQGTGW